MGRKEKILPSIKIKVVEDYLDGRISMANKAAELGVSYTSIRRWVNKYKSFGPKGLITNPKNTIYENDVKLKAITDYLSGVGSTYDICRNYNISSPSVLEEWIKKYNNGHKVFNSKRNKGDKIMTKGRKTTYEERIEIVSFCIANANDYNLTSDKYKVSYQQVYTWVKKYKENGYDSLVDRRGKNKAFDDLSESEKFVAQLKLLEAENRRLKMENDFLKKLDDIERR